MTTLKQQHSTQKHGGILPPPTSIHNTSVSTLYRRRGRALLHQVSTSCGRAFLCLLLSLPLAFISCSKDVARYPEMVQYHAESLTLPTVTADSVARFSQKVGTFVAQHPSAEEDPLYPEIQSNIQHALYTINIAIYVNTDYDEKIDILLAPEK